MLTNCPTNIRLQMYPEWVIIRVGGSPLRDLLSLCCAHLSCEGALWIIDGDSWEPLPIVLPSDFDSVDATAARRRIQEAAKAVGFGLDSFIKGKRICLLLLKMSTYHCYL